MNKFRALAKALKVGKTYRSVNLLKPREVPYGFAFVQLNQVPSSAKTMVSEESIAKVLFKARDPEKLFEHMVKFRSNPLYKQMLTIVLSKDEYDKMKAEEI